MRCCVFQFRFELTSALLGLTHSNVELRASRAKYHDNLTLTPGGHTYNEAIPDQGRIVRLQTSRQTWALVSSETRGHHRAQKR